MAETTIETVEETVAEKTNADNVEIKVGRFEIQVVLYYEDFTGKQLNMNPIDNFEMFTLNQTKSGHMTIRLVADREDFGN